MNKLLKSALSLAMALALMFSLGTAAFAERYFIENGDITVTADTSSQTVSQGGQDYVQTTETVITSNGTTSAESPSSNTVTINAGENATANVTLDDVHIDTSDKGTAAITVKGEGNVNIELDGDNTVQSGNDHAGVEKSGSGSLTINGDDNDKLTATGGSNGAGIGGGKGDSVENITINGGNITANGGEGAAGIGGGSRDYMKIDSTSNGNGITITGGTVNAKGGSEGAGIGGGSGGSGGSITIEKSDVTATGGKGAAGIGGGLYGDGTGIHITGGKVTATGGSYCDDQGVMSGAGIGGGAPGAEYDKKNESYGDVKCGHAEDITISDAEVEATGGYGAAGIGGGATAFQDDGNYSFAGNCTTIKISGNAQVIAQGGQAYDDNGIELKSGTAIGNGSTSTATGDAATLDTTGLTGWVELKNADGTLNKTIGDKPETPAGDSSSTGDSSETDSSSATSATLTSMDTTSPDASPLPVRYYVVTGIEQTWLADSEDGLEFTLNSDGIVKVLIDGEEVEFEINDNGDIVISAEVLQALESGAHEIEFVFPDGSCKANFTVK